MNATPTVETLLSEWIAAFNAHDLDRHMALYMEDAILFGSVDELQKGRARIRDYFGGRPAGMRVAAYPMPEVRQLTSDVAVTSGHVIFADGDKPSPYRMTWALVKKNGDWKIAQHHGSPQFGK
ncbi:MAG: SgcJ/EcaC family oxidoreductase [Hyphomicrobiales bacterium]|nr:SgcJ/EcaC family oxidoreductase [Hyphomicrobiales bacterium]